MDTDLFRYSLLIFITGLFPLVFGVIYIFKSIRWSKVNGVITNTEVQREFNEKDGTLLYKVLISLKYIYNGSIYASKGEELIHKTQKSDVASEKLSNYPVNKEIMVWCNPKKPQHYMIKEGSASDKGLLIAGLVLTGVSVAFMLLAVLVD